eukprot:GDKJ01031894.1.p1 GENE.GDKJ01031894.1~~GDKJ01031894.1.p1  ORF type:complete len:467 (+),score=84.31 GDKJ01031894.1:53-1453(+)
MEDWLISVSDYVSDLGASFPGTVMITLRQREIDTQPKQPPFSDIKSLIIQAMPDWCKDRIDDLIDMGAVHHRAHHQNMSFNRITENVSLITISINDPLRKNKVKIPLGTFRGFCGIRVHADPKVYPRVQEVNWEKRKIFLERDLIIFNKPSGVPCEPHASNMRDCVHMGAKKQLNLSDAFCLNRLDIQTSGLVAVATTKEAAESFNQILRRETDLAVVSASTVQEISQKQTEKEQNPQIKEEDDSDPSSKRRKLLLSTSNSSEKGMTKTYRVLTRQPVEPSLLNRSIVHFTPTSPVDGMVCPRFLSNAQLHEKGWKECVLIIEKCEKVNKDEVGLAEDAICEGRENSGSNESMRYWNYGKEQLSKGEDYYESTVRLLTGRTHQIRIQFAIGLNNPLVGDLCYEMMRGKLVDDLKSDEFEEIRNLAKEAGEFNDESLLIGLQSASLKVPDLGIDVEAPAPWWKKGLL